MTRIYTTKNRRLDTNKEGYFQKFCIDIYFVYAYPALMIVWAGTIATH